MTIRGYIGQVYEVRPILAKMEDRGVPIDDAARLALGAEFERAQIELGAELHALAPASCRRLHPKDGYKGVPPEVKNLTTDPVAVVAGMRFKESGDDPEFYHYEQRSFSVPVVDAATGAPVPDGDGNPTFAPTLRWCRVYDFNPNSKNQVLDYIRAKGHPIPKSKEEDDEGNQKDTTAAKELTRLAHRTNDTFYLRVVEYRGLTKMRGTYVEGFVPGPDGCVHTSFTFDTGIGQLSSRNPNVQNFPKLKPTPTLAKAMRRMIAPKPGMVLTEWDFKSCHVLTLGFLAQDPNYIRLARLDMHSFVAGHFLGLWDGPTLLRTETDAQLLARFKWLKSVPAYKLVRDDQAKHAILGIGNGLKARGLYERYMEQFPPRPCPECKGSGALPGRRGMKKCYRCKGSGFQTGQQVAESILDIAEMIFGKVFAWQREIQRQAHRDQLLRTEFGHIRRFYEVFRWDMRKNDWGHGDQSEEAISFWLSNIAFGHIRESMKMLEREGLAERYGLFNNVHDSFMFHFPESLLGQHVAEIAPVLRRPSTVLRNPIALDGLWIDVEASWTPTSWADMRDIPLPPATVSGTHLTTKETVTA